MGLLKLLPIIPLLLFSCLITAQDDEAELVIGLQTELIDAKGKTSELQSLFRDIITGGLTENGIASGVADLQIVASLKRGKTFVSSSPPISQYTTVLLTLHLENSGSKEVFATYTEKFKSIGSTDIEVFKDALLNTELKGRRFQNFLNKAKQKIRSYYGRNCDALLTQARRLSNTRQYLAALSRLSAIPVEISDCSLEVDSLTTSIYSQFEQSGCETQLAYARAQISNRQYDMAMTALLSIPNPGVCKNEYLYLAEKLSLHKEYFEDKLWERFLILKQLEINDQRRREEFLLTLKYFESRPDIYSIEQNMIVTF